MCSLINLFVSIQARYKKATAPKGIQWVQAENEKIRAELAKNQKKKVLLSKKDKTKAMIDNAAIKASETATATSNKRGDLRGKQLTPVSAIDNCQAAPPSGIDIVYKKGVLFITAASAMPMDSVKNVTMRNKRQRN